MRHGGTASPRHHSTAWRRVPDIGPGRASSHAVPEMAGRRFSSVPDRPRHISAVAPRPDREVLMVLLTVLLAWCATSVVVAVAVGPVLRGMTALAARHEARPAIVPPTELSQAS